MVGDILEFSGSDQRDQAPDGAPDLLQPVRRPAHRGNAGFSEIPGVTDVTIAKDGRRDRRHEVDAVGDPVQRSLDVDVEGGVPCPRTAKRVAGRNTVTHRRIVVIGQFCRSHQRQRAAERVAGDIHRTRLRCDGPLDEIEHGVADRPVGLEKAGVNARAALQGNEPGVHIRLPVQFVLGPAKYDDDDLAAFDDITRCADIPVDQAAAFDKSQRAQIRSKRLERRLAIVKIVVGTKGQLGHQQRCAVRIGRSNGRDIL